MSEKEIIKIFDPKYERIGTAPREEAHRKGLWHETFHCWLYDIKEDEVVLYFQQRSANKKDFPNQLDITAAGHLLVNETIADGFREVFEELGVALSPEMTDYIGVIPVKIYLQGFYDNEFTNVFIAHYPLEKGSFFLQEEEVTAIYSIPLKSIKRMLNGSLLELEIEGIFQKDKNQEVRQRTITLADICAYSHSYYAELFDSLEKKLENKVRGID